VIAINHAYDRLDCYIDSVLLTAIEVLITQLMTLAYIC